MEILISQIFWPLRRFRLLNEVYSGTLISKEAYVTHFLVQKVNRKHCGEWCSMINDTKLPLRSRVIF